jgi:glycosyltransferase involved in cell wall biosynthesis
LTRLATNSPVSDDGRPRHAQAPHGSRGRLCFLAPYVYAVATGKIDFSGGTEIRQWALARALSQRGFDVMIATCDFGQEPVTVVDGVTLLRMFAPKAGAPGVRFFYPRLWKAMRTLLRANADVYLANGSGLAPGWTYDAARLRGARFVFLSSSDGDAIASLPWLTRRRDRWWYLRGLRGADARIAQTEAQRRLFRENFAVETEVIGNPIDLPPSPADAGANDLVLWLSTYKPTKRPDWFIELARRLPDIQFVMIGLPRPDEEATWLTAQRAGAECPNLEVHGFVQHELVGEFLRRAALFVHTSPLEGFPMTLLEAWANGIPTVTAVDPGGVVARHCIGKVVADPGELTQTVAALMAAPGTRRTFGERARRYVGDHHGPDRTYEPLAALLDRLIARGEPRREIASR